MCKTTIEIIGGKFVPPPGTLNINPKKVDTIRYYYNQFGLGIPTGIGFKMKRRNLKERTQAPIFKLPSDNWIPIHRCKLASISPRLPMEDTA